MSRIDIVRSDMITAMKAGEKAKKDALSLLLSALKNKAIDKRADLTIEEEDAVVLKEIKQNKETLELAPEDRKDIIEECTFRIQIMEAYAPKMMGEEEIRSIIETVLKELAIEIPTGKDKGRIMKALMPQVKGKADGNLVNEILGSLMQ
ncbi:MAG: GatB/YqeY domain-containing protein [Acetivibrio sp.]